VKFYRVIVAITACMWATSAAAVIVNEQIMQKGQFTKADCQSNSKEPDYDDCSCDADIRYPQVVGMADGQTQEKLNDWFRKQAAKTVCEGSAVAQPTKDSKTTKSHAALSVHYEVTFSSPQLLAFKFTDWAYTGGAHGNGSVIGVIVDLSKGKLLSANDLFPAASMDAVNKAIYDALAAKPEEEIFRDQIEARKGAFIKNGNCIGCTLTLTPAGVHVLFQTYEVAPYGAGNTDVLIPAQYVNYDAVKQALAEQKTPTTEKK